MTPREEILAAYRVHRALQRERGVEIRKWSTIDKSEREEIVARYTTEGICIIPGMTPKFFTAIIDELRHKKTPE